MNAAGIVAEFNPFHNGHARIIAEARSALGEDCAVICVMSGNFVQRGEAAVIRKHARARCAVMCGADLVIELPVPYVLSSADIFAHASAALLDSLGIVTHLCFGAENADTEALSSLALALYGERAQSLTASGMDSGMSYAAARQRAAAELCGESAKALLSPNNLLGIEYIAALRRLSSSVTPAAFPREGALHDSMDAGGGYASASLIRSMLKDGADAGAYIPEKAAWILKEEISAGRAPTASSVLDTAVMSRLRALSRDEFEALPGASDGLGRRLFGCTAEPTAEAAAAKCKTKRYTLARIRRLILCAALGIDFPCTYETPPYIRVLAANEKGQKLLRTIKRTCTLPVITKPADAKKLTGGARRLFELEAASTDLYSLCYPCFSQRRGGLEWKTSPVII